MSLVGEAGQLYPFSWRIPPAWKMATRSSPGYAALISSHHQLSGIALLPTRICSRLYTMPDLSNLEALITRLAVIDFSQGSEQATREMAVNPVIGALGWDTFNPEEVAREYSVRGGRVDYCLRGQMSNLVLIEVKRSGTELGEHQEQLLRYAFDEGVPLAVLTDGLVWWLYLPMAGGSWEQRRFFRTNLREQHSGDAAAAIYRFLNREGLTDIPHIPSKFVEIVPLSHRQGNCIPYAAIRWHDFGNRPALGRPLGHFSRHPDTPLLSLSPRRRFPRPTPERVFVADHQSSSGFSGTGPSAPPPQPIGT